MRARATDEAILLINGFGASLDMAVAPRRY